MTNEEIRIEGQFTAEDWSLIQSALECRLEFWEDVSDGECYLANRYKQVLDQVGYVLDNSSTD